MFVLTITIIREVKNKYMSHTQYGYMRTGALSALILVGSLFFWGTASAETYAPIIHPEDFTTNITNPYVSLPAGIEMQYKGTTAEGIETITVSVGGETKTIMGVKTLVYKDTVWLDGQLIEDTIDYLAQDTKGNVWYFGEDSKSYENGKYKDSHGSWMAGVKGAQPGIWMKAHPKVGEVYRQEYLKGEAEDQGKVLSLSETVKVPNGTYKNCLKTLDFTELDRTKDEYKFYCPAIKGFALEISAKSGERSELIGIERVAPSGNDAEKIAKMQTLIDLLKQLIALLRTQ